MKHRFLTSHEAVAAAVRDGRLELGLSQVELAQRAGVSRRFVVSLEAGHERAELGKVLAVLGAAGVHAMALPAPENPVTFEDIDLNEVLASYA